MWGTGSQAKSGLTSPTHHRSREPAMHTYVAETIARQQLEESSRRARTAHQRRQLEPLVGRRFPKVRLPGLRHLVTARPA